jgi:DNA invertase Pin-like site-specific DNA recombinase
MATRYSRRDRTGVRVQRGSWPHMAPPGEKFRWGCVLRASKGKRVEQEDGSVRWVAETIDRQDLELIQHITDNRMGVIVDSYPDIASGWKPGAKRPRYDNALSDLASGRIEGIACLAVDRLTRRRDQVRPILNAMQEMGGRLFFLWDGEPGVGLDSMSDDPDFELKLHTLVARAEQEAERTSRRYKLAAQHRARKRLPQRGGARPYGRSIDWTKVVPEEAENLHRAALQIVEGISPFSIAADWNERAIPTVGGGARWHHTVLREMLRRPDLVGKREYEGTLIDNPSVPPILDEALWREVREKLEPNYRTMGRRESRQCSNLALCSVCSLPLAADVDAGRPTYVCKRRPSQPGACGSVSISGKRLDERVNTELVAFLNDKPRAQALLDAHKVDTPEMAAMDARFAELQDAKAALEDDRYRPPKGRKPLEADTYWTRRGAIEDEQEQLQRRRLVNRDAQPLRDALKQEWTAQEWESKPLEWRRAVIKLVCERIEVAKAPMKGGGVKGKQGPHFDPSRIKVTFADE